MYVLMSSASSLRLIATRFLPEVARAVRFEWHSQLSENFKVPRIFWSSMAQNVSGFLGCQETTGTDTRMACFSKYWDLGFHSY
jgi:hypothetical protein